MKINRSSEPTRDWGPPGPGAWWTPELDRASIKRLLRKRDAPGILFVTGWVGCLVATTALLSAVWGSLWVIPVLIGHGAVLSFAYAASHEGAHGTAFKTTWLNESVFYFTSFIFGEEPMYRRYSHGRHHSATWFPGFDSQMPYRNPVTLRTYLRETLALAAPCAALMQMLRHAKGYLTDAERSFVPEKKVRQLIWGSRVFLLGYASLFAVSIMNRSAFLLAATVGARLAGGWVVQAFINSQHMCMSEAVADHRFSTRSLACSLPVRILYWNMNFHVEHHLYPGVPFHALPAANRLVKAELPVPARGVLRANLEILRVIFRQAIDPQCVARPSFQSCRSQTHGLSCNTS